MRIGIGWRRSILGLACLVMLGLGKPSWAKTQEEDLRNFVDAMFMGQALESHRKVVRWAQPIRYSLFNSPSRNLDVWLDTHLEKISKVIGVPVNRTEPPQKINLHISYFQDWSRPLNMEEVFHVFRISESETLKAFNSRMRDFTEAKTSISRRFIANKHVMDKSASIIVPKGNKLRPLARETMQVILDSLVPNAETDAIQPSFFNNSPYDAELHQIDMLYLYAFYHSKNSNGSSLEEAKPIVIDLMREMLKKMGKYE